MRDTLRSNAPGVSFFAQDAGNHHLFPCLRNVHILVNFTKYLLNIYKSITKYEKVL